MELAYTDGRDPRFHALCRQLDEHLDEAVGGETQRTQYNRYNTLTSIHDVVLILEDGQAVACGGYKEYAPDTAEIKRVFAKPECRGRGYGRAVMAALETRAAQRGYTRLILETGHMLHAAIGLYTAIGFRRIPNYGQYRCMEHSICMEKRISEIA